MRQGEWVASVSYENGDRHRVQRCRFTLESRMPKIVHLSGGHTLRRKEAGGRNEAKSRDERVNTQRHTGNAVWAYDHII